MPHPYSIKRVIHAALLSAFSITTALIWKDVIIDAINSFVPPGEEAFYRFLVALIATLILIIALYILLKTESEAEYVIKKLKGGKVKLVKAQKESKLVLEQKART